MEVTALCMRLLINVLMILVAENQHCYCAEKADAASLGVVPNRLQLFEYESIFFDCEGFDDSTEWRVMRRIMGIKTICGVNWQTSQRPCLIQHAFEADSGEYWCEANRTRRSNSVNISVTAGSVILESPALPVREGDAVTLRCRNKTTSSVFIADFYKDGNLKWTGYDGNITIQNVSKSNEGLYKCNIIGVGESAESWLAVGEPSHHHSPNRLILVIALAMCLGVLLLLVVQLYLCGKLIVLVCISSKTSMPRAHSRESETASGLTSVVHPQRAMYSRITANTNFTESGVSSFTATPVVGELSVNTDQSSSDVYYCTID